MKLTLFEVWIPYKHVSETVILYAISEFYKFIGYHISPKSKEYINVLSMHCVHSYMLMSIKGLFVAPEIYLPLFYSC